MSASSDTTADFEAFVRAHLRRLVGFGVALSLNEVDAWDLVQESLARAFPRWHKIDAPLAYVRTSMIHINLNRVRRRGRESSGHVPDQVVPPVHVEPLDPGLVAALEAVSPQQRTALALRYLCDCEMAEVAQLMGCREATARSHLSRGLSTIRQFIAANDQEGRESWTR